MKPEKTEFRLHESYVTRLEKLEESDTEDLHHLSVAVNWPHRPLDIEMLFKLGQGVIARDAIRRPLGTGMSFQYGIDAAMIGMMITHPKLQAGGLGRNILTEIEKNIDGRQLRLNSTRSAWRLYQSAGFRETGKVIQYQGFTNNSATTVDQTNVRLFQSEDLSAILALDALVFGADRSDVISHLLSNSKARVICQGTLVSGFALCRPFGQGYLIGPLVAEFGADAITLASSFIADHAGKFVRLDADSRHQDLGRFLNQVGLATYDEIIPMVKGQAYGPERAPDHIYALASQALG